MKTEAIVLAAGQGRRMHSSKPKVLQKLAGTSLINHVIQSLQTISVSKTIVVTGHMADQVKHHIAGKNIIFTEQAEQLGTAHAVSMALPELQDDSVVIILYGDVPLVGKDTIRKLINVVASDTIGLLTVALEDPTGYGRIVRDANGAVTEIIEHKDASQDQLKIREINTGVIAIMARHLRTLVPLVDNNNRQKEFYLTDIIKLAKTKGITINTVSPKSPIEVQGVNDKKQLSELERSFQKNQADKLLEKGVTIVDPKRFDLRGSLQTGKDCLIDINCVFEGDVRIGNDVHIEPNCIIKDSCVEDGVCIKANSIIEDSEISTNAIVGPFARLRPGSKIMAEAKVGNFVEIKNSQIGLNSKVNHLAYVGDSLLGSEVNIGAGTITCNYDGADKHQTIIDSNVFVGSNSTLVAPVHIRDGAFIGAGSTITSEVPVDSLGIGRARQKNITGWKKPNKKSDR